MRPAPTQSQLLSRVVPLESATGPSLRVRRNSLVAAVGFSFPETAYGTPATPHPTITGRDYNFTQALPAVLAEAEREAGQILAKAGLSVIWSECWPALPTSVSQKTCKEETLETTAIRLRILPTPVGNRLQDTVFGFAIYPVTPQWWFQPYYGLTFHNPIR